MVITQTPLRMSFLGGGTDYKEYYNEYDGSVLTTTFDKYCFVTVRHLPPFFEYDSKLVYSKIECFNQYDEIEHPMVRECLREQKVQKIHISYDADLPARTGLATSSAFAVGLYQALYALQGTYVDKKRLADDAIRLEREILKEAGGIQDQIEVSFGGLNRINFHSSGYEVLPVIINDKRKREFNDYCMLFFTGFVRYSSDVAVEQVKNVGINIGQLNEMKHLVDEGEKILINNSCDIKEFGKVLNYSWQLKRGLTNRISTNSIDELYKKAIKLGALGGKLLGAGGGGFLLLFAEPEKQKRIIEEMRPLLHIPFKFENNGCKIIYYKSEEE